MGKLRNERFKHGHDLLLLVIRLGTNAGSSNLSRILWELSYHTSDFLHSFLTASTEESAKNADRDSFEKDDLEHLAVD